jgi:prepilin-type N-terminal cleavage/methylation domain-containing protein/prepilin-type processing-associated H-X9-DG protein
VKREKRGFTLIELLVVIAIIAILAAILFPVFSRAREQARKAACLSNTKQIGQALAMYIQDWDETLPIWFYPCRGGPRGALAWTEQLYPYVKNWQVFQCPSAGSDLWGWNASCYPGTAGRPQNNVLCHYGYNQLFMDNGQVWFQCATGAAKLSKMSAPSETVVIADSWVSFLAPWAVDQYGIETRVAYANIPDLPGWGWQGKGFQCGCPANTIDLNLALETYARHTLGANLVFADGHAKWYKGEQIRTRRFGGQLRFCPPDL